MIRVTAARTGSILLALGAVAPSVPAQEGGSAYQVRAKEIVLGDGNRVENGVLVVEDGRIARVGRGVEVDERLPLIDHDGVLTAGMIACQTESGGAGETHDSTRSMLAEARLVHAFDPDHSDFEKAVMAGITTVVLTPSGENVVGGLNAVVKTHGGTVVARESHLALSFARTALGQRTSQFFFFFDANRSLASEDGGLESTSTGVRGTRVPTSYAGTVREVGAALTDPAGPYARAARGELPVFLEAWDRNEVQRAVSFARERGLSGALYGAPLASDPHLVRSLAESGLGVVLGPYSIGQTTRSLDSLRALHEAGVPVAFALDAPEHDPAALRLSAAMALARGADAAAVWSALTSSAARIAGVADRVGTLERGKDADFVLWSGDPLNLASRIEAVYVGGELAHAGEEEE